ncbi:MAG: protein kinase, partial [Myxococcota bacterium]
MGDALDSTLAGRWHLRREIGSGGAAVVFEAFDQERGETVAIKIAKGSDAGTAANFYKEFELLYGIRHPHLVVTYAFGQLRDRELDGFARGAPYLVQELAPGTSGRNWHAPSEAAGASVGAQLGAALAALHARGVRHNDVTPANVMIDEDGNARLLDFGLAGGQTGAVAGTLRYMAPESMAGRPVPASDVYGLAATLAHLIRGEAPSGPHGAAINLEGLLHDVLADMSVPDPLRRPNAEACFRRFLDAGTEPAMTHLRDQTLRTVRGRHDGLRDQIRAHAASDAPGASVLVIGGAPGSGRTGLLHDAVATAVGAELRVLGLEPLPAERALRTLALELNLASAPVDLALFEAIREQIQEPVILAIDDLESSTSAQSFVDYLLRLGD